MKTREEVAREVCCDSSDCPVIAALGARDAQHMPNLMAAEAEARAAAFREAVMIARQYTDGIATRAAVSVAQGIGDRIEEAAKR